MMFLDFFGSLCKVGGFGINRLSLTKMVGDKYAHSLYDQPLGEVA